MLRKACLLFFAIVMILSVLVGCNTSGNQQTIDTATTSKTFSTTNTTLVPTTTVTTITSNVTATQESTTKTSSSKITPLTKKHIISSVPIISQKPNYPSACESVSAVMALRYWGESITVNDFIDNHLPMSSEFYWENQRKYGPNPYDYFIGNPYTTQAYGCMAPVIEKALVRYFGSTNRVLNTSGEALETLCEDYIDRDIPVLVWVTIGMIDTYTSDEWLLKDGTKYEWPANEHCMVLIGYDENYYYFNDPYRGTVKQYAKWLVEKRYQQLGLQSVVITG